MKCRYCADTLRVMNEKLLSKIGENAAEIQTVFMLL